MPYHSHNISLYNKNIIVHTIRLNHQGGGEGGGGEVCDAMLLLRQTAKCPQAISGDIKGASHTKREIKDQKKTWCVGGTRDIDDCHFTLQFIHVVQVSIFMRFVETFCTT